MNYQNNSWELVLGKHTDTEGIQKVFDDVDFSGKIGIKFNRSPDPYQSLLNDGEALVLPLVKDSASGEVLAVGGSVIRTAYVNGKLQNTAYLTALKILRSRQQKLNCIRPAYALISEQCSQYSPFYYTTILSSNETAVKLLEKPHKGMPLYLFRGIYTVFFFGSVGANKNKEFSFVRGHSEKLALFYKENLPKYNLAPKDEWLFGLKGDDFYCLVSENGEILAACAIWNQQSYKQYKVTGYKGIYRLLSYLPTKSFGFPSLPKAGCEADYLSIANLIVKDNNIKIARLFLQSVLNTCKGCDFIMLGLFENHPLFSVADTFKNIKYKSRLYTVDYGNCISLDIKPIMLEVGLL